MGRPKESLPIGDTTMLGWQCRTLLACTEPVIVIGRSPEQPLPELPGGVDIALDETPDEGPLAAIATGLRRLRDHYGFAAEDAALTVGCDQPFLTAATVLALQARLGTENLLMPRANDKLQPLTAIYRVAALEPADQLLATGSRRPRELADTTSSRIVEAEELREIDPELRFLRNLNHPDDYLDALRLLAPGSDAT